MRHLTRTIAIAFLIAASLAADANAGRVVVRRGPRGRVTRVRVTTHAGFPLHRTLPTVVVRTPAVRVAPRVYLSPVRFSAVVVSLPPASARTWSGAETIEREDDWTDFTINVDERGKSLVLEIDRGAAQISFAEIVFENGDAQVVDFDDRVHAAGVYSLLDIKDGRKVDHVRIIAKANTKESVIRLHMIG